MPPLILFEYLPRANSCLESVFLPRKHTLHNQVYACIHSKILSLIHCTKVYMPISMKACVCIALCICSIHTFPIHTLPVCIDCYRVNTQTHRPYQSLQAAMSMRPSLAVHSVHTLCTLLICILHAAACVVCGKSCGMVPAAWSLVAQLQGTSAHMHACSSCALSISSRSPAATLSHSSILPSRLATSDPINKLTCQYSLLERLALKFAVIVLIW